MNSKGRHRNKGIVTEASCASCRKTEPSERLRTQPSILHYKARHSPRRRRRSCLDSCSDEVLDLFEKEEVVARRSLDLSTAFPAFKFAGRARTLENHSVARQPKPNPRERKLLRVPVKSIAIHPSCCPRGSGWPTDSSALPTHTRGIDWRCFQLRCNPGTGTHSREESVGASGTNQHRPIVLKRWKA